MRELRFTANVLINEATSSIVDLGDYTLVGLLMPAALTSVAVKFSVSVDGTNFFILTDGSADVSKTVAASKYIGLDPALLHGIRYLKLVFGANEAAARTIGVVGKLIN